MNILESLSRSYRAEKLPKNKAYMAFIDKANMSQHRGMRRNRPKGKRETLMCERKVIPDSHKVKVKDTGKEREGVTWLKALPMKSQEEYRKPELGTQATRPIQLESNVPLPCEVMPRFCMWPSRIPIW